ncbi:MAG TPA: DinB family protein [Dehalococcoidia bacterium]|nr:DinB family protein [Dehalococcoidia bacterium]
MSRLAVDQYVYMLDQSFDGNDEHGLIAALNSLQDGDWDQPVRGGSRTVANIVGHVMVCKLMYDHYAFADARLRWDDKLGDLLPDFEIDPNLTIDGIQRPPPDLAPTRDDMMSWLHEGHRRLRTSVDRLDDAQLVEQRKLNWGGTAEARWIITVMIQHDLFHAGEINHLRAIRQGNDRWAWEIDP